MGSLMFKVINQETAYQRRMYEGLDRNGASFPPVIYCVIKYASNARTTQVHDDQCRSFFTDIPAHHNPFNKIFFANGHSDTGPEHRPEKR